MCACAVPFPSCVCVCVHVCVLCRYHFIALPLTHPHIRIGLLQIFQQVVVWWDCMHLHGGGEIDLGQVLEDGESSTTGQEEDDEDNNTYVSDSDTTHEHTHIGETPAARLHTPLCAQLCSVPPLAYFVLSSSSLVLRLLISDGVRWSLNSGP